MSTNHDDEQVPPTSGARASAHDGSAPTSSDRGGDDRAGGTAGTAITRLWRRRIALRIRRGARQDRRVQRRLASSRRRGARRALRSAHRTERRTERGERRVDRRARRLIRAALALVRKTPRPPTSP